LVAFLIVLGCSKSDDFTVVNPNGNELKSGIVSLVLMEKPNLKMVHLVYTSPVNLENATVEITMPQIISFVNGPSSPIAQFPFTPNNIDKPT
jgi:hypothetical protein